jgi:chaperone modulatory protein CbpM
MNQKDLIRTKDFCIHHNIEFSFISNLESSGLVRLTSVKRTSYIPVDEIPKLEKFVRLYYELDINIEGIETIDYLLERIEEMQKEILHLRNRNPL